MGIAYDLAGNDITATSVTTTGAVTAGSISTSGAIAATGVLNASTAGLRTKQDVSNVHDTAPTAASLTSAFGSPATLGRGFVATIDDADGDTNGYLVFTSDASWYFLKFTKAS